MEQRDRMTQSNEDYLEAVYELTGGVKKPIRSVDLAKKLDVSKASVNKAVSILKDHGFVTQEPYGDIFITDEGLAYGRSVFKRHQTLYHFLMDELGVAPEIAEDEACKMEHAISDDTLGRWINYLENKNPESAKAAEVV